MSVLLFPPPELRRPPILTAWASVAVCETIRHVIGRQARIKWPNDVLVGDRKVCGILIEQTRGTVAGIGLNVNQTAKSLAEAGLPSAGSLCLFTNDTLDRWDIARRLIESLDQAYDRLCRGDLGSLEAGWRERIDLQSRPVRVEGIEQTHLGRLRVLSWERLELELDNGETLELRPETVRHVEAL
jgi:BirA family biotin operon repressor/biotin-[acetyl-CoA-carboxylase] ligase